MKATITLLTFRKKDVIFCFVSKMETMVSNKDCHYQMRSSMMSVLNSISGENRQIIITNLPTDKYPAEEIASR